MLRKCFSVSTSAGVALALVGFLVSIAPPTFAKELRLVRVDLELVEVTGSNYSGLPRDAKTLPRVSLGAAPQGKVPVKYLSTWNTGFMALEGYVTYQYPAVVSMQGNQPHEHLRATIGAAGSWNNNGLGYGRPTGIVLTGSAGEVLHHENLGRVANRAVQASFTAQLKVNLLGGGSTAGRSRFTGAAIRVEFHGPQNRYVTLIPVYEAAPTQSTGVYGKWGMAMPAIISRAPPLLNIPEDVKELRKFALAHNMTKVKPATEEEVFVAARELKKLPPEILKLIAPLGIIPVIVTDNPTQFFPNLKGEVPRGYEGDDVKWEDTRGLCEYPYFVIAIPSNGTESGPYVPAYGNDDEATSSNTLFHELAHCLQQGIDKETLRQLLESKDFKRAFKADFDQLTKYDQRPEEAFAEGFASYFSNDRQRLNERPNIANFWANWRQILEAKLH